MGNANRWWKLLGVASVVGVVATGALVVRDERQRRAYTPDEVRDRLKARLDQAEAPDAEPPSAG
jgi:hypothetical protein